MFLKQLLSAVSFINFRKKLTVFQIVQRFLKPNLKKALVTAKHIAANGRYSYRILQLIDTNADGRYRYSAWQHKDANTDGRYRNRTL